MSRAARTVRARSVVALLFLVSALLVVPAPRAVATSYPPAPEPGSSYLSNLSSPPVAPGASSTVRFVLTDPTAQALDSVVLTFAVYAFNGYPGDAVSPLPVANAPTLDNGSATGPSVNVTVGTLMPHAVYNGSITVRTSSATPSGTFAVRTAVAFSVGSTAYRLESRGWFSQALWQNATVLPNGSGTLNLTRLNVSGVVPETAVLVDASAWPVVLDVLLATGLVLVGVGAFVYFRRPSSAASSSGAG